VDLLLSPTSKSIGVLNSRISTVQYFLSIAWHGRAKNEGVVFLLYDAFMHGFNDGREG
jgi:hypothetical protein